MTERCECCKEPATHTELHTGTKRLLSFCDRHSIGCKKKITAKMIARWEKEKIRKERPQDLWDEFQKTEVGMYCSKCLKEGKKVAIIKGTNICPYHGRI